jgi:dTDP-L-rhamnose 4-epimerase
MQEEMILTCCASIGVSALSFRYQNVYGPGQSLKNPYTGILSIFSTQFLNNKPVNIFEDGEEARDFVFIDDVADATIAGLESDASGSAVNVGTGIATSVMTVAQTLKRIYNSQSDIKVSGNYRLGDIRNNIADITLLKEKLSFKPKINFADGIEKFAGWVKTQNVDTDRNGYERSLEEMKAKGLYK